MLSNVADKCRQGVWRACVFVRLIDPHDSNISITNIALVIALFKLATAPVTSLTDIGALMVGLLNYSYKKYLNQNLGQAADITNKIIKRSEDVSS